MKDASIGPGAALRVIADHQLSRASQCLGWKGGLRHKGVHQARKSIRRVRSILALAGAPLGPKADALSHLLSEVNQGLSHVRDSQALVEAIDHLAAHTKEGKWLRLLARARKRAVEGRRVVLTAALAVDPELLQARTRLDEIKTALGELAWDAVSVDEVDAAFSLGRKQTRKAARKAGKTGQDDDWHRWRRKARRQAQQHRILSEAGIKSTVKYDDKEMAEVLGQQQDCSLLLEFCRADHSPIRWADRNQLDRFVSKRLQSLRKELATHSVDA